MVFRRFQYCATMAFLVVLATTPMIPAGVQYDPSRRTIRLHGFARDKPATLADIRSADQAAGWNTTAYDAVADVTVVSAHLLIGKDDGTCTFLWIGGPAHPRETLVIKGNLWVKEPKSKGYRHWEGGNGLILGMVDKNQQGPSLKFDCASRGEFGLKAEPGSRLECYQATLTALTPNPKRAWTAAVACDPVLIKTTLSWFAEFYPFETLHGTVQGCTYEHGTIALGNGEGYFEDCTFRDLDVALSDGGCLDCTVVNCRFEGNGLNWALRHTERGIRAIDCFFGSPKQNEVVCQPWKNPITGRWHHPLFFAQRHMVVEVKNTAGKPIAGAKVVATNEQGDLSAVAHGVALTGQDGRTPPPRMSGSLLLVDYLFRASAVPGRPYEKRYTYTITVTAKNHTLVEIKGVHLDQTWMVKGITLRTK